MRYQKLDFKQYKRDHTQQAYWCRLVDNHLIYVAILLFFFMFTACQKEKMDMGVDNRAVTENRERSNVRIINMAGFNQVISGKDSLTNFIVRRPDAPDTDRYPGTSYFPVDGRLGKSWVIPQDLFNQQDQVKLTLGIRNYQGALDRDITFQAANDYRKPMDYFLMPTLFMDGQPDIVAVPRAVSAPSKPDHFKIRVVNLGGPIKHQTMGLLGMQENLTGAVSLAYADGTLVSTQTNNIQTNAVASDYIELPYGTYQFRLLLQDGRQLPAVESDTYAYTVLHPSTSTIAIDHASNSNLHYAPVTTYQPGGVYTIVVAPREFNYHVDEVDNTSSYYQNAFQVLTDVTAPANRTYSRIQAANARAGQPVNFRVDGKPLANALTFGQASNYLNMIQGTHMIEALDASGKVLASLEQAMQPAQNYTIWLYPQQDGKPQLLLVANDLSGSVYTGAQDDASFAHLQYQFYFPKRFLNLSVGNPYVTFTVGNGQSPATSFDNRDAVENLQPGIPKMERPYIGYRTLYNPFEFMVYRSTPDVVPGIWASDISVLTHEAFIANKKLYEKSGRPAPVQEAGVYTVALIGKSSKDATAADKARMILVKHTR